MKTSFKKILALGIISLGILGSIGFFSTQPVSARPIEGADSKSYSVGDSSNNGGTDGTTDGNCVDTSIIGGGSFCDDGTGSSISKILRLAFEIASFVVGAVGLAGIVYVGVRYMTAGGNEEKTRVAKRRMLEIVIGLVAYFILFAILEWLLPDFDKTKMTGVQTGKMLTILFK